MVTMEIDRKFLPVYKDATILLRPKTGLKDMFLELDPGTKAAGSTTRATRSRSPTPRRTSTSTKSFGLDSDTGATCACSWSEPARG